MAFFHCKITKTAMLELLKSATCANPIIKPTISPITASITTLTSAFCFTLIFDHRKGCYHWNAKHHDQQIFVISKPPMLASLKE
jgi:hypothetical protein